MKMQFVDPEYNAQDLARHHPERINLKLEIENQVHILTYLSAIPIIFRESYVFALW
jgi:hypothetical protein